LGKLVVDGLQAAVARAKRKKQVGRGFMLSRLEWMVVKRQRRGRSKPKMIQAGFLQK
jgi:hypothetical protein